MDEEISCQLRGSPASKLVPDGQTELSALPAKLRSSFFTKPSDLNYGHLTRTEHHDQKKKEKKITESAASRAVIKPGTTRLVGLGWLVDAERARLVLSLQGAMGGKVESNPSPDSPSPVYNAVSSIFTVIAKLLQKDHTRQHLNCNKIDTILGQKLQNHQVSVFIMVWITFQFSRS